MCPAGPQDRTPSWRARASAHWLRPLAGTQILRLGAPVLRLTCGAVAAAAALGQITLALAIRNRSQA
jgi:hypothetical protein